MKDTVVIAGATSFIVGMSTSFAYVMTLEQVPETLSAFILGISNNKTIILLLMNIFLLVVGMFMDNISSCTILAPILLPVAVALGVNPVHFGIVMTMNLAVGFITPPTASTCSWAPLWRIFRLNGSSSGSGRSSVSSSRYCY